MHYHSAAATCVVTQVTCEGDPAVDAAHAMGIAVYAWTVDDPGEMELLFGYGVDGIITDRPDNLRTVIDGMQRSRSGGAFVPSIPNNYALTSEVGSARLDWSV